MSSELRGERNRYRATVEYDGSDYYGFQIQADQPTIQGALEQALADTAGEAVRVAGAGRTDTGVHALGQVIGFRLAWRHSLDDLQRALNARLPEGIVIRELAPAEEGFHPRFSARSRVYRYTVLNQPLRSPLARRFAHQLAGSLDLLAMNAAAASLLGGHDFATFGNPPQGENTVREVMRAVWTQAGNTFFFDIEANAFLRRMVRTVVSALLLIGQGGMEAESMAALLAARDRSQAPPPAPACGLCLMQVKY
ncbi:MAG: tRNA pseudouridine(38-40) synthase TruA [Chloroflexi bacterium]|nr:tRNA pseudouridine(38-40) synthase TruA [Chloroflexota bacterium]